jgi:hypothetical protein
MGTHLEIETDKTHREGRPLQITDTVLLLAASRLHRAASLQLDFVMTTWIAKTTSNERAVTVPAVSFEAWHSLLEECVYGFIVVRCLV